jgi:ubiquinone/menaquinone biosynthesis C-methylase UbiE
MARGDRDRMPDLAFKMMSATFTLKDRFFPGIDKRIEAFEVVEGMTVVDYGCGPGRYTTRFSRLVGDRGKVYAVDVQELALETVKRKMQALGLSNIIPVLARGYSTDIPDQTADMVFALDMFFGVRDPAALLAEIHRIVRPEGVLVLDDGHQSRESTLEKINRSGKWEIEKESRDHLRLVPR